MSKISEWATVDPIWAKNYNGTNNTDDDVIPHVPNLVDGTWIGTKEEGKEKESSKLYIPSPINKHAGPIFSLENTQGEFFFYLFIYLFTYSFFFCKSLD